MWNDFLQFANRPELAVTFALNLKPGGVDVRRVSNQTHRIDTDAIDGRPNRLFGMADVPRAGTEHQFDDLLIRRFAGSAKLELISVNEPLQRPLQNAVVVTTTRSKVRHPPCDC